MTRRLSIEISPKIGNLHFFIIHLDDEIAVKSLAGDLSWCGTLKNEPVKVTVEAHGTAGARYHVLLDLLDEINDMAITRTLHSDNDRFQQIV